MDKLNELSQTDNKFKQEILCGSFIQEMKTSQ